MPDWLTSDFYTSQIQPRPVQVTRPAIAAATGISIVYAGEIRNGNCVPYQRHWETLAYWREHESQTFYEITQAISGELH